MVERLEAPLRVIHLMTHVKRSLVPDAQAHIVANRGHHAHVYLVEREVEVALAPQALHDGLRILEIEVYRRARRPAAVASADLERHLVVRERDEGLDRMPQALVHDVLVEGKVGLVGLVLVARGIDADPVDREAIDREPISAKRAMSSL